MSARTWTLIVAVVAALLAGIWAVRLVRDADEARLLTRSAKPAAKSPAKKRAPKTAVEALDDVRQADRDVKKSRKEVVAGLHPVKAAQQAAKRAATKAAKKTAA